jgi:hypothetical protein
MFLLNPDRIDRVVYTSGSRALAGLALFSMAIALPPDW